ncbi:MAG: HEAT repeat domain-containing protein [bacterium]|nr:HEAT repeat domain-containing protein [bacterium]
MKENENTSVSTLPVAFSQLRSILIGGSPGEKFQASELLAKCAHGSPEALIEAGNDTIPEIRQTAAWAIGKAQLDSPEARALLQRLADDEDKNVRTKAIYALKTLGGIYVRFPG